MLRCDFIIFFKSETSFQFILLLTETCLMVIKHVHYRGETSFSKAWMLKKEKSCISLIKPFSVHVLPNFEFSLVPPLSHLNMPTSLIFHAPLLKFKT